jgi:hypothetical protein
MCTSLRVHSAVFDPFSYNGLPPNEALSSLPPLPDTPQHTRSITEGLITAYFNRTSRDKHHSRTISKDWLVDLEEEQEMEIDLGIKKSESQRSLGSPNKYPVLSTRQSSLNTPRNPSPTRVLTSINTSVAKSRPLQSQLVPQVTPQQTLTVDRIPLATAPRISASFQLPSGLPDASMIGDCAPPSLADDSEFDISIEAIRPRGHTFKSQASTERTPARSREAKETYQSISTPRSTLAPKSSASMLALAQSTLLPQSPALSKHLASSTNDLMKVVPPWLADNVAVHTTNESMSGLQPEPSIDTSPESPAKPTPITRQQPAPSSGGIISRKFPPSSSAGSLVSVLERAERPPHFDIGEKSTILPVSPAKFRQVMREDNLLQCESFDELPSFRLPEPDLAKRSSPRKYETMKESRSRHQTPTAGRTIRGEPTQDAGDVTLDFGAMMAKMGRPKRASGTEESFTDLLRGDDRPDELDMWVPFDVHSS